MNPVALPPGCARLATKPAPTGSMTVTNTIGTVRVACSNAATVGVPLPARRTSGASAANSAACRGPAGVDPQVAAFAPAQLFQGLCERGEAGLSFRIVRAHIHE